MHTPIVNEAEYPIRLCHIDIARSLAGAFGGFFPRKERAAYEVMLFLKKRDKGWKPFKDADFQAVIHRKKHKGKRFEYRRILVNAGLLNIDPETGMISVTHEFVSRYFLMCPNLIGEAPQERQAST